MKYLVKIVEVFTLEKQTKVLPDEQYKVIPGSKNNRMLAIVIRAISTFAAGKVFTTLPFCCLFSRFSA